MKHLPLVLAALLIGCDSSTLEASDDESTEYKKARVKIKGGAPDLGHQPALNIEDCDNNKDDDGDGRVDYDDPDCEEGGLGGPDGPPSFGSDTGEGPSNFIPWDDEYYLGEVETRFGMRFIARTPEFESHAVVMDDYDALRELFETGDGEALYVFSLENKDTEGLKVTFLQDEETGMEWVTMKDYSNDQSWALTPDEFANVAVPFVEPKRGEKW